MRMCFACLLTALSWGEEGMGSGRGAGGRDDPVCFGHFIEVSGRLEPLPRSQPHIASSEVGAAMGIAEGQAIPSPEKEQPCFESPF